MSNEIYRVIFVGEVIDDRNRDTVKTNLATLFGTTVEKVERLFTGSPLTIKKGLTREEALRFRDGIIRAGALCRIETMEGTTELLVGQSSELASEKTGKMVCPRCRKSQAKAAICRHCGVIVADYRERHQGGAMPDVTAGEGQAESETEAQARERRLRQRRQDLEASVNISSSAERRNGLDRRKAHRNWHL